MKLNFWSLKIQTGQQDIPVLIAAKQAITDINIVEAVKLFFKTYSSNVFLGNLLIFPLHTKNIIENHALAKNLEELTEKEYNTRKESFLTLVSNRNLVTSIETLKKKVKKDGLYF